MYTLISIIIKKTLSLLTSFFLRFDSTKYGHSHIHSIISPRSSSVKEDDVSSSLCFYVSLQQP